MSGQASTTSSGSTRAMSAITRSGGSTLSLVTNRCSSSRPSSFPGKKRSTPTSRIVATRARLASPTDADNQHPMSLARGLELIRAGEYFEAHEELEDEWREAPAGERDFLQGLVRRGRMAARGAGKPSRL